MDGEPKDLTTRVLVEIRDELRGHTRILTEHGRILTEHEIQLRELSGRMGAMDSTAVQQGVTLRQILRAVEVGNERRDGGFDDHERRIARLESHTGIDR